MHKFKEVNEVVNNSVNLVFRPKKKMCVYGPPTDPNFWPRP